MHFKWLLLFMQTPLLDLQLLQAVRWLYQQGVFSVGQKRCSVSVSCLELSTATELCEQLNTLPMGAAMLSKGLPVEKI